MIALKNSICLLIPPSPHCFILAISDHAPDFSAVNDDNSGLTLPYNPVRLILGRKSPNATPMRALAAYSKRSEPRTSGRRSSNPDGKPAGTSGGNLRFNNTAPRAIELGLRPKSIHNWFSFKTISSSTSGTIAAAAATRSCGSHQVILPSPDVSSYHFHIPLFVLSNSSQDR